MQTGLVIETGQLGGTDPQFVTGAGNRDFVRGTDFSSPYATPPEIVISLKKLDMQEVLPPRIQIEVAEVTREGLKVRFETWGNTRIVEVQASWIAIGVKS